jgi:hypothetical protein
LPACWLKLHCVPFNSFTLPHLASIQGHPN